MLPLAVMQFFNYTLEGHPNAEIQHVSRRRPRPLMNANDIEIRPRLADALLQRGKSFGCVADSGGYILILLILHAWRWRGRSERFQDGQSISNQRWVRTVVSLHYFD